MTAATAYHGRRRVNALLTRTGAARGRRIVHAGGLLNAFPLRASSVRDRFTTQYLGPWATQRLGVKVLSRSLTVRALVGSRPPLGDVWHAASGASQTSLRSTLNFAQNQERGLAACKTLANLEKRRLQPPRESPARALDVGPALLRSSCTLMALCRLARPRRRCVRCERPKYT